MEVKKTRAKLNKTKIWFFEKIKKSYKSLGRLIRKKKGGLKSVKLGMKKEKLQCNH